MLLMIFTLVVTTHFLACAMKNLDIKSLNDMPSMEQFHGLLQMLTEDNASTHFAMN